MYIYSPTPTERVEIEVQESEIRIPLAVRGVSSLMMTLELRDLTSLKDQCDLVAVIIGSDL